MAGEASNVEFPRGLTGKTYMRMLMPIGLSWRNGVAMDRL